MEDSTASALFVALASSIALLPNIDTFALAENLRRASLRFGADGMTAAQSAVEQLASTVAQVGLVKEKELMGRESPSG